MISSRALLLAFVSLLTVVGCGGLPVPGGEQMSPGALFITSSPSTLAVNATSIVALFQQGYGEPAYALSVKEGALGGALTVPEFDGSSSGINRIYTAPATPGNYHIVGTVTEANGKTHTKSLKIVVTAAASPSSPGR